MRAPASGASGRLGSIMRIRILRGVVGAGGQDWAPGEEHDAPPLLARDLVGSRAAEIVGEAPAPGPLVAGPDGIQRNAEPHEVPPAEPAKPRGKK